VKLAEILPIDLKSMSAAHEGRTLRSLLEVFGDPIFKTSVFVQDVKELASSSPARGAGSNPPL